MYMILQGVGKGLECVGTTPGVIVEDHMVRLTCLSSWDSLGSPNLHLFSAY